MIQQPPKLDVAIVGVYRTGDIVNTLPIAYELHRQGAKVYWYGHIHFTPILEATSYIEARPWHGLHRQLDQVLKLAADGKHDRTIIVQVDGNESFPTTCDNFILQAWANAGQEWLPRFHDLPLIFDNRDPKGEQAAFRHYDVPEQDGRPLLVYCVDGHSSPFPQKQEFLQWLHSEFGTSHRLCRIGGEPPAQKMLPKAHHLLGILEAADLLLTIDTLPLHLGYAFHTPTIALHPDKSKWYWSEPRRHWLGRMSYADAVGTGRNDLASMIRGELRQDIVRDPTEGKQARIRHVIDWFVPPNGRDRIRIEAARQTWERIKTSDRNYHIVFHEPRDYRRSSRSIGDTRTLPIIGDIVDHAAEQATDEDILLWSNSDVSLVPEAAGEIRRALREADCCYSRRVDVADGTKSHRMADLSGMKPHVGADVFAFRTRWWRQHRQEIPDVYLSCEGWDAAMRRICEKYNPKPEMSPCICWHERHESFWSHPANVHSNPAQVHNRKVLRAWATENGHGHTLYPEGDTYLFRPDSR